LFVPVGVFAACGQPAEAALIVSEAHALEACEQEDGCDAAPALEEGPAGEEGSASMQDTTMQETTPEEGGWVSRCENDGQCGVGRCVCGVCTESCNGEPDACSGLPGGAACFGGRTLPRAALCHATTVPGICLLPCNGDDECGEGTVCALGACMPEPEASAH
jgi:hypothetical protein